MKKENPVRNGYPPPCGSLEGLAFPSPASRATVSLTLPLRVPFSLLYLVFSLQCYHNEYYFLRIMRETLTRNLYYIIVSDRYATRALGR